MHIFYMLHTHYKRVDEAVEQSLQLLFLATANHSSRELWGSDGP